MVEVKLGRLMKTYNDNVITLDDGSTITAKWSSGLPV